MDRTIKPELIKESTQRHTDDQNESGIKPISRKRYNQPERVGEKARERQRHRGNLNESAILRKRKKSIRKSWINRQTHHTTREWRRDCLYKFMP